MLKQVKFLEDYRTFKKGEILDFEPLTLLVGDQGCGKSSLLNLIANQNSVNIKKIIEITADKSQSRWFDFEKFNPRIQSRIETTRDLVICLSSHGQFVRKMSESILYEKNVVWIQDEPDMALSIRSCLKLVKTFKESVEKNNCQVIASIHSPVIIKEFPKVLSLEHKRWLTSQEFIQSQYE